MRGVIGAAAVLWLAACSGGSGSDSESAAARGEKIYKNVCATCHNVDPRYDGTVGPAIAGSSLELLQAKVLNGKYPPGYTPKRQSAIMPQLPHLKANLPDIAAYLQSSVRPGAQPGS